MPLNRREILKIAGCLGLGLACPPLIYELAAKTKRPLDVPASALTARSWGMAIDIAKCRNRCPDCITACHEEHNVPSFLDSRHQIRWIGSEPFGAVFPGQDHRMLPESLKSLSVPVLCNHCDNPPCVRVCPTGATFKRPDGITMMDYHRCIGCRFCMAGCPYGSRSMNWREPGPAVKKINPNYPLRAAGVVEKCNFCEERLAQGKLPACVAACPQKAMTVGDLADERSEIRRLLSGGLALRRRGELGTGPQVYYLWRG